MKNIDVTKPRKLTGDDMGVSSDYRDWQNESLTKPGWNKNSKTHRNYPNRTVAQPRIPEKSYKCEPKPKWSENPIKGAKRSKQSSNMVSTSLNCLNIDISNNRKLNSKEIISKFLNQAKSNLSSATLHNNNETIQCNLKNTPDYFGSKNSKRSKSSERKKLSTLFQRHKTVNLERPYKENFEMNFESLPHLGNQTVDNTGRAGADREPNFLIETKSYEDSPMKGFGGEHMIVSSKSIDSSEFGERGSENYGRGYRDSNILVEDTFGLSGKLGERRGFLDRDDEK